jgi:hypothetical protein
VVLEFQLTSNVRLNNLTDLRKHPMKGYLAHGIDCVMGTDGWGLYGTDGIDEQLALSNFLEITDEEFLKIKAVENNILSHRMVSFEKKLAVFPPALSGQPVMDYYLAALNGPHPETAGVDFHIRSRPTYPVFKDQVKELPWDKYPIIIAGSSFTGSGIPRVSDGDRELLQALLDRLDPQKVFFVMGHRLSGHERYILEHNPGFDIYCILPALMPPQKIHRLQKAKITGVRISTEAQEMGIYKSFNYEIFERRNCTLFAFCGNTSVANLVQEARNGKGKAYIFINPGSPALKAKAASLEGYVTLRPTGAEAVEKIQNLQNDIGTKR